MAGNKKRVYILLKILKKCTAAEITSFKVRIKIFPKNVAIKFVLDEVRC